MPETRSRVFLSWSGDLSLAVARLLKQGLEDVLQHVDAFLSDSDIAKGADGHQEIMARLGDCCCGIIVLTKFNYQEPWVLYEAGAIAGRKDPRLAMPFLVDLAVSDLAGGPLNRLQCTTFSEKDVAQLVTNVNGATENALDGDRFGRAVSRFWGQLEAPIKTAIRDHTKPGTVPLPKTSPTEELLKDILRGSSMVIR